jgi:hypothetical protein
VLQQVVSILGYACRAANVTETAESDPEPKSVRCSLRCLAIWSPATTATGRIGGAHACASFGSTTVIVSQRAVSAGFGEFSISIVTS